MRILFSSAIICSFLIGCGGGSVSTAVTGVEVAPAAQAVSAN